MKLTINTIQLQSMVAKSIKGASCNKMIPITGMMAISCDGEKLTLTTTDANNYLMISCENHSDAFYSVVPAVIFSQLIMRLSTETTVLEDDGDAFKVHANGVYTIELPLDENGDFIKFPKPYEDICKVTTAELLNASAVRKILKVNKPALATTLEVPCYTGYYAGEKVISTDTYKLCGTDVKIASTPMLIAPETMQLLDLIDADQIEVVVRDNEVLFKTDSCVVYGNLMYGIEDYQVDAISALLDEQFDQKCAVTRNSLIAALDRVGLFIGAYDNRSIQLQFAENSILISTESTAGEECVICEWMDGSSKFTCAVNVDMLISLLKSQTDDIVVIGFGKPNALKLIGDGVTQVIALDV